MSNVEFWAESHRTYLHLLGTAQLDRQLIDRVDLSGVLQTTMLEAYQQEDRAPQDADQQRIWLRRIFMNNLLDALRKLRTQKRDVRSEVPIERSAEHSASRVQAWLSAEESTPSVQAMRKERVDMLLQAISRLPGGQQEAIRLHHLQSLPLEEVSRRMDRPKGAVAALIYRGMQSLRASDALSD